MPGASPSCASPVSTPARRCACRSTSPTRSRARTCALPPRLCLLAHHRDDPAQRAPFTGPAGAGLVRDQGDGETVLARSFTTPAPRRYSADAWLQVAAGAPDPALDRLAGYRGGDSFSSSGRFDGDPAYRARPRRSWPETSGWIGEWLAGHPAWLGWSAPQPLTVARLTLVAPAIAVRRPTLVRLRYDGGRPGPCPSAPAAASCSAAPCSSRTGSGGSTSRRRLSGRYSARERQRRAVGIARVSGCRGTRHPRIPVAGPLAGSCADAERARGRRRVSLAERRGRCRARRGTARLRRTRAGNPGVARRRPADAPAASPARCSSTCCGSRPPRRRRSPGRPRRAGG